MVADHDAMIDLLTTCAQLVTFDVRDELKVEVRLLRIDSAAPEDA